MTEATPIGQRYSLLYSKPPEPLKDSKRLRKRMARLFDSTVRDFDEYDLGRYIEGELGIDVVSHGPMSAYVDWNDILLWELRDLLCVITLIGRYASRKSHPEAKAYPATVSRILAEEAASYRIDDQCGVHPLIDSAFSANLAAALRGLEGEPGAATQRFMALADENLLPGGDLREVVRASFDAVENLFKANFRGATSLNKANIQTKLRPAIELYYSEPHAKRSALKICDGLLDWAEACHIYRHAPGTEEPSPPPEEVAVALASQAFTYVRWLSDVSLRYSQAADS